MDLQLTRLGFTMEEAAAMAGIGRTRVYAAVKDGKLKARKFGRRTVILREDLEAFLRALPARESNEAVAA